MEIEFFEIFADLTQKTLYFGESQVPLFSDFCQRVTAVFGKSPNDLHFALTFRILNGF